MKNKLILSLFVLSLLIVNVNAQEGGEEDPTTSRHPNEFGQAQKAHSPSNARENDEGCSYDGKDYDVGDIFKLLEGVYCECKTNGKFTCKRDRSE